MGGGGGQGGRICMCHSIDFISKTFVSIAFSGECAFHLLIMCIYRCGSLRFMCVKMHTRKYHNVHGF